MIFGMRTTNGWQQQKMEICNAFSFYYVWGATAQLWKLCIFAQVQIVFFFCALFELKLTHKIHNGRREVAQQQIIPLYANCFCVRVWFVHIVCDCVRESGKKVFNIFIYISEIPSASTEFPPQKEKPKDERRENEKSVTQLIWIQCYEHEK